MNGARILTLALSLSMLTSSAFASCPPHKRFCLSESRGGVVTLSHPRDSGRVINNARDGVTINNVDDGAVINNVGNRVIINNVGNGVEVNSTGSHVSVYSTGNHVAVYRTK